MEHYVFDNSDYNYDSETINPDHVSTFDDLIASTEDDFNLLYDAEEAMKGKYSRGVRWESSEIYGTILGPNPLIDRSLFKGVSFMDFIPAPFSAWSIKYHTNIFFEHVLDTIYLLTWDKIRELFFDIGDVRILYYWLYQYSHYTGNAKISIIEGMKWAQSVISYNTIPTDRFVVTEYLLFYWLKMRNNITDRSNPQYVIDEKTIREFSEDLSCPIWNDYVISTKKPYVFTDCNEFFAMALYLKEGILNPGIGIKYWDVEDEFFFYSFERIGDKYTKKNRKVKLIIKKDYTFKKIQPLYINFFK